jgi:protein SCO1/2
VDTLLTYCYRYDPAINRHSLIVARVVQAGCLLTVLILGGFLLVMFRRDLRNDRAILREQQAGNASARHA